MIQAQHLRTLTSPAGLAIAQRAVICSVARRLLYMSEAKSRLLPGGLARHQASCLVCQAETVRQRNLLRGLADLRDVTHPMPGDLSNDWAPSPTASDWVGLTPRRTGRMSRRAIASAASIAAIGVVVVAGRRIRSIAS